MAKVALLGLFGFVMVNFHTTPPAMRPTTQATEQHSNNLSQFSRTLTKLQMSDDVVVAVDNIPLILTSHRQFITRFVLVILFVMKIILIYWSIFTGRMKQTL
jgi:hypothetical protein